MYHLCCTKFINTPKGVVKFINMVAFFVFLLLNYIYYQRIYYYNQELIAKLYHIINDERQKEKSLGFQKKLANFINP